MSKPKKKSKPKPAAAATSTVATPPVDTSEAGIEAAAERTHKGKGGKGPIKSTSIFPEL